MTLAPPAPAEMFRGDELPAYKRRVRIDGDYPDLSADFTFTLTLKLNGEVVVTKTDGIFGDAEGYVTVGWAVGELNKPIGLYDLQITALRGVDNREWTFDDKLRIKTRTLAES